MLVWPALALLKQISNAHISVLVPAYTAPMAHICPSIDSVIVDPGPKADRAAQRALVQQIKGQQFDCAIAVFSNGRNARLLWQANIPHRFAPATKWAQILYNHRLRQRRSQSAQPEWRYNVDLIRFALTQQGFKVPKHLAEPYTQGLFPEHHSVDDQPSPNVDAVLNAPNLVFKPEVLSKRRQQVASELGLNVNHRWLVVHPGTGGSVGIVATAQYAQFIDAFIKHRSPLTDTDAVSSFHILVTAGPNETELAKALVTALSFHHIKASVFNSKDGLVAFAEVIANSALYLAASTGPLHIAGALDVPTIGVFPARRSSSALRWQPINQPSRHWPISVPNDARDPEDLTVINWAQAGIQARAWFDQLSAQDKVTAQD